MQARMLNAVGDAIIAVDTDHNIIFWNDAAARIYGWRAEEVIGHNTARSYGSEIIGEGCKEDPGAD